MLGRFVGSFKTGQPGTAIKKSGDQWVEWCVKDVTVPIVGYVREESLNGPAVGAPFTENPVPFSDFLAHLEKSGYASYDIICHQWDGSKDTAFNIKPLEDCVLPLPSQVP